MELDYFYLKINSYHIYINYLLHRTSRIPNNKYRKKFLENSNMLSFILNFSTAIIISIRDNEKKYWYRSLINFQIRGN